MNPLTYSPVIVGVMRLGLWGAKMNTAQIRAFVDEALSHDLTTFDQADIYGDYTSQAEFGEIFKEEPSLRDRLQLISKYGIRMKSRNRPAHAIKHYDASAAHMVESLENSLRELHTDHVDLLLIHRPDLLMEPEEIAEAANRLIEQGKIKAFGVSNFSPSQVDLLQAHLPLATNQIEASLLHLDPFHDGSLDQLYQLGIKPMAWSPFGGGRIFSEKTDPRISRIHIAARPLMEKHNCTLDQLLLAWLLRHPSGILPVIGTTNSERLGLAAAATKIKLSRQDWYQLYRASTGSEVA